MTKRSYVEAVLKGLGPLTSLEVCGGLRASRSSLEACNGFGASRIGRDHDVIDPAEGTLADAAAPGARPTASNSSDTKHMAGAAGVAPDLAGAAILVKLLLSIDRREGPEAALATVRTAHSFPAMWVFRHTVTVSPPDPSSCPTVSHPAAPNPSVLH